MATSAWWFLSMLWSSRSDSGLGDGDGDGNVNVNGS